MQKRKLSASVIILFIAATTLVSGTYAWFMVGGFASLFSVDYNVIETSGGLEVQGSAGSAYDAEGGTKGTWGAYLALDNFNEGEFIPNDGTGFYTPVSPKTLGSSAEFVKVGLKGTNFNASSGLKGANYNDFSINIRSAGASPVDVEMKIKINGTAAEGGVSPAEAGRVAVTYKGTTTVFALNDTSDSYVTNVFTGDIVDTDGNRIITSADTNYADAGLRNGSVQKVDADGNIDGTSQGLILTDVPANTGSETIYVQTWLEGNDSNCVDLEGQSIQGGQFVVDISFSTLD